ncbi:hypothetical protein [Legionella septentrionalis]|uniref:Uncharacterized protein n=1 Tax=Legionella septentrionalis TaxID=2498109 RepID=A0A3S0VA48_9GAMM|nr:hypothetical protein [Legionella septentrionalis]RUQ85045.1 hypothetical protein EKM59_07875 [Legionella septentrionalis]
MHFKTIISDLMEDTWTEEDEFKFIKTLHPYAEELNIMFTRENDLSVAMDKIVKDPLVYWLNSGKDSNFNHAKNKMIKRGLIPNTDFHPTSISEFRHQYTLEYFCSAILRFLLDSEDKLKQIPALKEQHSKARKAMIVARDELFKLGTIPFANEVWQTLLQMALNRLLNNDNRNIYSTGKFHEKIASELMSKKIMSSLYLKYWDNKLTNDFVVNIALTTTAQFFSTTMDMKEAKNNVKKIKADIEETRSLLVKTVSELLTEYALANGITW